MFTITVKMTLAVRFPRGSSRLAVDLALEGTLEKLLKLLPLSDIVVSEDPVFRGALKLEVVSLLVDPLSLWDVEDVAWRDGCPLVGIEPAAEFSFRLTGAKCDLGIPGM